MQIGKVIVALDVPNLESARDIMNKLAGRAAWMKIGLQLYIKEGPNAVKLAKSLGFQVFLDLKLHDIPNTVAHAVVSANDLGVDMLTLHTLGGPAMLTAAADANRDPHLQLLGVTILTSMNRDQMHATGIGDNPQQRVIELGKLALSSGINGVVASPLEIQPLKQALGPSLKIVTPGIRPVGADAGDQQRIMTPSEAVEAGADWIVVGRPITAAPDPVAAFDAIVT